MNVNQLRKMLKGIKGNKEVVLSADKQGSHFFLSDINTIEYNNCFCLFPSEDIKDIEDLESE